MDISTFYEIISPTLRYIALRYFKKEEDKAKFSVNLYCCGSVIYVIRGVYKG